MLDFAINPLIVASWQDQSEVRLLDPVAGRTAHKVTSHAVAPLDYHHPLSTIK